MAGDWTDGVATATGFGNTGAALRWEDQRQMTHSDNSVMARSVRISHDNFSD
jgi:hypothetical protein